MIKTIEKRRQEIEEEEANRRNTCNSIWGTAALVIGIPLIFATYTAIKESEHKHPNSRETSIIINTNDPNKTLNYQPKYTIK